jgi:hypothetical protein
MDFRPKFYLSLWSMRKREAPHFIIYPFPLKLSLHNIELHNLYSSQNITGVTESRRWVQHVACVGRGEIYLKFGQ